MQVRTGNGTLLSHKSGSSVWALHRDLRNFVADAASIRNREMPHHKGLVKCPRVLLGGSLPYL